MCTVEINQTLYGLKGVIVARKEAISLISDWKAKKKNVYGMFHSF